jgi:RNA polymerase sigma-70 factor (ECF subfamily)
MDFWEIYDSHYARVRHYATSMLHDPSTADDVVQETFLRVQKSLETVREPAKVSAWVLRIAHNLCIDHLRSRPPAAVAVDVEPDKVWFDDDALTTHDELERGQMSGCVRAKIEQLPENHRSVLVLCDIMELSQQEVASILDLEVGAVKVRLHRARTKLRAILKDQCSFTRDGRNVMVCEPAGSKKQ